MLRCDPNFFYCCAPLKHRRLLGWLAPFAAFEMDNEINDDGCVQRGHNHFVTIEFLDQLIHLDGQKGRGDDHRELLRPMLQHQQANSFSQKKRGVQKGSKGVNDQFP